MAKRPELLIVNGPLEGKRFAVKPGGLRLGRSSSNDVKIPDEELSRNHCLFEFVGDSGVRLTDLASANGTYLNGKALGSDPVELKVGDQIGIGTTMVKVVGEEPPSSPGKVDLGLGDQPPAPAAARRSPLANWIWALVVLSAGVAIWMALNAPMKSQPEAAQPVAETEPTVCELYYEKVEASSEGIFRYELTLTPDRVLKVTVDDVPKSDSNIPTKSKPLDDKQLATLNEILAFKTLREIDREYVGPDADPPRLNSWSLKVVYDTRARRIRIVNTQEPEAFRAIREKLEAFSKNELGIWAMQYSREKLISLAEESLTLARSRWDEREVQHGNLFNAVSAFRECLFYLETVNPKPDFTDAARSELEAAQRELDQRYADQRFLADRAINLGQWETAQRELVTLMELIPDRSDDRNREAAAKLIDVEKRLKGGK